MGLHNCSTGGKLDDSKFGEPMPWIGVYIAAASLLCSLLMGIDTIHGFRRRKLWFPCRFFSLNATSLTLLSVATKLLVDLSTSMPRPLDQLSKLSGTVLICTAMGNFITSLGAMNESALISNVIALGILVITVIGNIGIQMSTGAIYVFLPEHAIIMFFMLVLLVILCSTTLMVPTVNKLLEHEYERRAEEYSSSIKEGPFCIEEASLRVRKLWMMTGTSGQYVVGHSATCTASGALCILSALILLQAAVRSLVIRSLRFCQGKSDYTWSIIYVLISQAIAIGVGNIAPAFRWLNTIIFMKSYKSEFTKVERYWVHKLEEWKEKPLSSSLGKRTFWKSLYVSKNQVLGGIIRVQKATVLLSKLVGPLPASWFSRLSSSCCKRLPGGEIRSEAGVLVDFFSYLEGDAYLLPLMVTNCRADIEHWISKGKSRQQDNLVELLMKSQGLQGDNLVKEVLGNTRRPTYNCMSLVVVTLTSIAITIAQPCNEEGTIKSLHGAANEGLRYVRLVENNVKFSGRSSPNPKMMRAADIVWPSIDFYDRWLGNDLTKMARREDTAATILKRLEDIAEKYVLYHGGHEDPRRWSPKVYAANLMDMLCKAILQRGFGPDHIFQVLQKAIADTIGDYLKYLPQVIHNVCTSRSIESREQRIREAAYLLGELEKLGTKEGMERYLRDPGAGAFRATG